MRWNDKRYESKKQKREMRSNDSNKTKFIYSIYSENLKNQWKNFPYINSIKNQDKIKSVNEIKVKKNESENLLHNLIE